MSSLLKTIFICDLGETGYRLCLYEFDSQKLDIIKFGITRGTQDKPGFRVYSKYAMFFEEFKRDTPINTIVDMGDLLQTLKVYEKTPEGDSYIYWTLSNSIEDEWILITIKLMEEAKPIVLKFSRPVQHDKKPVVSLDLSMNQNFKNLPKRQEEQIGYKFLPPFLKAGAFIPEERNRSYTEKSKTDYLERPKTNYTERPKTDYRNYPHKRPIESSEECLAKLRKLESRQIELDIEILELSRERKRLKDCIEKNLDYRVAKKKAIY